jgi:ubiquitin-conjugating enzyme E2 J1
VVKSLFCLFAGNFFFLADKASLRKMESAASPSSRNPAVRRIMSEWKELKKNKSSQLCAHPLEDNLFEFHFTIRGAAGTDFEGGLYHGRILLPHNYPLKPPNIVFLTPNGRFDVGMKICLTVSAHHPETWQVF